MRHRMQLESPARTPDGAGGVSIVWALTATVWAALEVRSGSEDEVAGKRSGILDYLITLRHRTDLRPEMRFVMGERIFEIHAVLDDDATHGFVTCACQERDL